MAEPQFDVIVVGSGAGGAVSALTLTRAGLRVLMLEAGRNYDPVTETPMFNSHIDVPLGNMPTEDRKPRFLDPIIGGTSIEGEPYTVAEGSNYSWLRTRMLGGRTNAWWGLAPRFGPYDFKNFSRDGYGVDWPVTYDDIAPFYDKIERMVGLFGVSDGFENEPGSPEGVLQPPPPMRAYELFIKAGFESFGIPVKTAPTAILTQPKDGRQACFYATDCRRGCSIGAKFQTPTSLIPLALQTGNLTVQTDAMVNRVLTDATGRATGVRYADKKTGTMQQVTARAVVLAASTYETARLLLVSGTDVHPAGLANSSGQVGKNCANTLNFKSTAHFPLLEGRPQYNEDGVSVPHMYVPWWGYQQQAEGQLDFPRGYHFQIYGDRVGPPGVATGTAIAPAGLAWGKSLKQQARERYGAFIHIEMLGEMLPNADSYMDLDPTMVDRWGTPVPRFHWKIGEPDRKMIRHAYDMTQQLVDRLGGTLQDIDDAIEDNSDGAGGSHETGSARMGAARETSVVNDVSQCWDVDNLVLADGSVFATHPHKNPTLTIMALSLRAAEALAARVSAEKAQGASQ